jgi:arylsulfatase A-like enzyme
MPLPPPRHSALSSALTILLAASAFLACAAAVAAPPAKPNIVFILADDLGWSDVGWHGSEIRTPNLDKLAAGGARLEHLYVLQVCSPTRAALLTGRYPMRYGLQSGVVRPWADYGLPLDERTLPQALKDAGYATWISGKWHLGHAEPAYLPSQRGFDRQYGHYNGAIDYFTHVRDGGFDWHRDDRECRDEGYSTHLLAQEAVRRIRERDPARPFFLYAAFNAVHAPLQVPGEYTKPYTGLPAKRRKYAGMVAALDEAVGRIVAALEEHALLENTLIVFSSDNGGPVQQGATNGKLRAGKGTLYEGGVRAAAFAHWRGRIRPGTVVEPPLHMVDWYPTLLRLAGASLDQKLPLDGRDVWPCIADGARSPHEAVLINAEADRGAIRAGDWKLVLARRRGASVEPPSLDSAELYDLAADPSEAHDLSAKHPEKVKELRDRYEALAKHAVPAKGGPAPPGFKAPRVWGEKD